MPEPVLRTERLVLRPLTPDLAATLLDGTCPLPQAPGFPRPDDLDVARAVLASGDAARGQWVLEHEGELVGTLGAVGPPSPEGDQELGYGLVDSAQGAGLGLEAVGALCAVLERRAGVRRLTAEVLPGNDGSVRLLRRLGFVPVDGGSSPHVLMARAAPGDPPVRERIVGRHVC